MLRKIRIGVSLTLFFLITLYFLDFAEILPRQFHVLTKIQLIPALLALEFGIIIALVLLTLIFGRIYCSSICPLGIYQDFINWFSKKIQRKKRFRYLEPLTILRWSVVGITLVAFLASFNFLVGLLDPYSAYGRISIHIFKPAYLAGNNLLESIFTQFDNHTFYRMGVYVLSISSLVIALITLATVSVLAWTNGRIYCNSICPVGTVLGLLSKFSLFKIRIDESTCNSCGSCGRKCKASCIDTKLHSIDYSRCINCFDCIEVCSQTSISFSYAYPKKTTEVNIDASKRRFMLTLGATSVAAGKLIADKNLIIPETSLKAERRLPISPPGSLSHKNLLNKCTSCHLCVSKCPSEVIKPSFLEYGLAGIMQPMLYFDKGFCNYDCTICSEVCPTGAIGLIDKNTKHHTQTGQVQFVIENCIVYTDETHCGACSEHCPTQAVSMVPYKNGLTIPHTEVSICVGCGGCEYICPAKPYKAIFVEGITRHETLTIEKEAHDKSVVVDDFGF
jgi:ferredoxin